MEYVPEITVHLTALYRNTLWYSGINMSIPTSKQ